MKKNKSKHFILITYWLLVNCLYVQPGLVILIIKDIVISYLHKKFLRINILRLYGLLGLQLIINNLIVFSTWTNIKTTLDL